MECACSSADRVPGYEPVGRGFESPQARHKNLCQQTEVFCFPFWKNGGAAFYIMKTDVQKFRIVREEGG